MTRRFPGMRSIAAFIKAQAAKAQLYIKASPPLVRVAALVGPFLLILLAIFYNALRHSKSGALAGALGSLIGGIVGAGGAVWAVFLMLSRQRREETEKVADAVRTEVTTLVKYIVGSVKVCQGIANGTRRVPRQAAQYIVKNLLSDPVVYPAVADRVGLLPYPQAITEFYMRLSEAKSMVEALRTKIDPPGITYSAPSVEYVTPEFAATVADSLCTALQIARPIVGNEGNSSRNSQLSVWVQERVVGQIDDCLKTAKETFPNIELFQVSPGQRADFPEDDVPRL
jgi:hypothetical protein